MFTLKYMSQHGSFLLGALVLVIFLTVIVLAVTNLVTNQSRYGAIYLQERKAFYAAESGAEYALGVLEDSSDWRDGAVNVSVGEAKFSVSVDDSTTEPALNDTVRVTSIGSVGSIQRNIEIFLVWTEGDWPYPAFATHSIHFGGDGVINGDIHANGTIALDPSKWTINGTATVAPPTIDPPTIDWSFFQAEAVAAGRYYTSALKFEASGSPYSGIWYTTDKVEIKDNVVINGTIIAELDCNWKGSNISITAPSKWPALIVGHDIKDGGNNVQVAGFIYTAHDFHPDGDNMTITGAICAGPGHDLHGGGANKTINWEPSYCVGILGVDFGMGAGGSSSLSLVRWQN